MTERFVQGRVDELKRVMRSMEEESRDPESKDLPLADLVAEANRYIASAVATLEGTYPKLRQAALERHNREGTDEDS